MPVVGLPFFGMDTSQTTWNALLESSPPVKAKLSLNPSTQEHSAEADPRESGDGAFRLWALRRLEKAGTMIQMLQLRMYTLRFRLNHMQHVLQNPWLKEQNGERAAIHSSEASPHCLVDRHRLEALDKRAVDLLRSVHRNLREQMHTLQLAMHAFQRVVGQGMCQTHELASKTSFI